MDLEKEIKLLKEKIELLEKVKELQDMIKANEKITTVTLDHVTASDMKSHLTSEGLRTLDMGASGNI